MEGNGSAAAKIVIDQVAKRFGKVMAVDGVSFSVQKGEVLGLLGPSGCGKTTILRCISGLEDIDSGTISLDGRVVSSPAKKVFVPPEKRRLGFVFQSYALWPHMTIRQNIAYCLKDFSKEEKERRIASSLDLVGLSGLGDRYPSQLSGGQQQRVALARSLSYEPEVILLDEPMSNLDMKERERVRGELRTLLKRIGITTVFVTHDQEEAFVISDRVILLEHGKMVQQGSPEELYANPANLFVAQFIGRTNVFKVSVKEVTEQGHVATLAAPDLGTELVCASEDVEIPRDASVVAVRYNEITISKDPFARDAKNVVQGTVLSREYRGSVTDHKIQVGNAQVIVTTHRFCMASESPGEAGTINVHIPPAAIRPLKQ